MFVNNESNRQFDYLIHDRFPKEECMQRTILFRGTFSRRSCGKIISSFGSPLVKGHIFYNSYFMNASYTIHWGFEKRRLAMMTTR